MEFFAMNDPFQAAGVSRRRKLPSQPTTMLLGRPCGVASTRRGPGPIWTRHFFNDEDK
jgi:hypothetical protein